MRRAEDAVMKEALYLRGDHYGRMWPPHRSSHPESYFEEIIVAGVTVRALVDSGASTSCCTRKWYQKYQNEVEPFQRDASKIVGVRNIPINADGRIGRLPLEWADSKSFLTLLVIPTLEEPDMILGMDVLQRFGVRIDTRTGTAKPSMLVSSIKPEGSWKIPARTSVVFPITNPYRGQGKKMSFSNPVRGFHR